MKKEALVCVSLLGLFFLAGCTDYEEICPLEDKKTCERVHSGLLPLCENSEVVQEWKQDHPEEEGTVLIRRMSAEEFNSQILSHEPFQELTGINSTAEDWWQIDYPPIPTDTQTHSRLLAFVRDEGQQCFPVRYY